MYAGMRALAAVLVFGLGMVGIAFAVPQVYRHFEPVYLSAGNESLRFIIRLGPILVILAMFFSIGWASFRVSPIRRRRVVH